MIGARPRPRHVPEDLPFVGPVDAGGFRQVLGDRREAGEEEDGVVAEAPPHFHDRDRGQGQRRPAQPLRRVLQGEQAERVDQEVVYRADLVVVHPLPQHEDERARNDRRNEQHHAVEGRQALIRHPVDEDREQQRQDDRSRQEHDREQRRAPQARPHQRVVERRDVVVEPDPVRRLVGEELVVGEADPEDADDRIDLIADEEDERRQQEQPRAGALQQLRRLAAGPPRVRGSPGRMQSSVPYAKPVAIEV